MGRAAGVGIDLEAGPLGQVAALGQQPLVGVDHRARRGPPVAQHPRDQRVGRQVVAAGRLPDRQITPPRASSRATKSISPAPRSCRSNAFISAAPLSLGGRASVRSRAVPSQKRGHHLRLLA